MNHDDLQEYISKIMSLSNEERENRNEYLRQLADGTLQGPPVGNALVDLPWLTRYADNIDISANTSINNLYQIYVDSCKDRLDDLSVFVYMNGKEYTNRELIQKVEEVASGLAKKGINDKSTVGFMLNGSAEEAIFLLAVLKLGANVKYIDYMKSVPAMKHNIDEVDLDLIVMDECFIPLNPIINEKNINVAVANTQKSYDEENVFDVKKISELGQGERVETFNNPEDKVCLTINSSGTTGVPKPICHTYKSVCAAINKMLNSGFPIKPGNVVMKMIPSQIGLGVITSLLTGLIGGSQVVLMVAKPDAEELIRDMGDFIIGFKEYAKAHGLDEYAKINVITAPMFARGLIFDDRITDMSNVVVFAGGSKMGEVELVTMNDIARKKGCEDPICNGYGQNEMAGAVAINTPDYNRNGSAGFPTKNTEILIVDPVTHEVLGNNEIGLILESSDSKFAKYDKMPELTEESKVYIHGREFFDTRDLGYISPEGFLYVTGRLTRVVIRSDFKIPLDDLEKKINTIPEIKDSAVIKGETNDSIEEIIMFVELQDGVDSNFDVKTAITSFEGLSPFEQPNDIVVLDKIPYKDNGKIDYKLLETEYFAKKKEKTKV